MNKEEAIELGRKVYDSSKPCREYGHIGQRYVSNNRCVECCKTSRAKDMRNAWRANNREHIRTQDREYALRNKENISAYHSNRYQTVLRVERIKKYKEWKHTQSTLIRDTFRDAAPMSTTFVTEAQFAQYLIQRIVSTTDLVVFPEYSPSGDRRQGRVDLYIPDIKLCIEAKLDAPYWRPHQIERQVHKYEQWAGEGNVIVTSPEGHIGVSPDAILTEVQNRLLTLRERSTHELL